MPTSRGEWTSRVVFAQDPGSTTELRSFFARTSFYTEPKHHMTVPHVVNISRFATDVDEPIQSVNSDMTRLSVCQGPLPFLDRMSSTRRSITSKYSRWESNLRSWGNDSETSAANSSTNSLSRFDTFEYGRGRCTDQEIVLDCAQWPPRKPLRKESLTTEFHGIGSSIEDACPCNHTGQTHQHEMNGSERAIIDYSMLASSSSPRTTIKFRAIRPPRKPVRQVSSEPC